MYLNNHLTGKCRHCEKSMPHTEQYFKSFFTEQRICKDCFDMEKEIRQKLVDKLGLGDDMWYQRTGHVPEV